MEVLDYLKEEKGFTGYRLAKEIDEITSSKLTHIKSGRNRPSLEIIDALVKKFPRISKVWILTGDGEMLVTEKRDLSPKAEEPDIRHEYVNSLTVDQPLELFQTKAGSQYEELPNGKYKLTVPFVPVKAQARYVYDYTDAEFISDLQDMTFIVDRVGNGKYLAFEIQNDSMDDNTKESIPDGAVVLARELGRQHWKSKFRTTQYPYWIIVHKSTVLCKEITHHDVEKGIITCHSLNDSPEYPDFELHLDDVRQLFNIIKKTF